MAGMPEIPDGGFSKRDQFEAWLNDLPEGKIRPFAGVLSHRAAMRVLPQAGRSFSEKGAGRQELPVLALTIFRANIISRAACKYPTPEIRIAADAAATRGAADAAATRGTAASAVGATLAATRAASLATRAATTAAAAAAAAAASASAAAAANSAEAEWSELTTDSVFLLAEGDPVFLRDTPVWPDATPKWWQYAWRSLRENPVLFDDPRDATGQSPDWSVWLDWYEPVATGRPAFGLPREAADARSP